MNAEPTPALPKTERIPLRIAGHTFHVSRFSFLLAMGVLVGAVTALVSVGFRLAAVKGEEWLFPYHGQAGQSEVISLAALRRLLMPVVGGLICGVTLFRIGRFKGVHGVPEIMQALALGRSHLEPKMLVPPALATVTLATGGSAGPEGPIAEIGSVAGSLLGRWAKVPPKMIKTLIGAGVAAGIAGVFNAPMGGLFFAVEVILRDYEIASFTPIAIASVTSSVIVQALLGDKMAIQFPQLHIPGRELLFFAVLGLVCGGLSLLYVHALGWAARWMRKLGGPLWLRPALGGLLMGVIGVFFPNAMGEGYDWIRQVIVGHGAVGVLLALLVIKIVATGITLGSGNPGGSFAPAVFIGVMSGAVLGRVLAGAGWVASAQPYAVMGMAGLITGALGAPITAILITLRHTQYMSDILLPVMTTVAMSAYVMQAGSNVTVYTREFLSRGIDLDRARRRDPLSLVKVEAVMRRGGFEELPAALTVDHALERLKDSAARWFVVRETGGAYAGIVSLHEMRLAIDEEALGRLLLVAEITDGLLPRLNAGMSLKQALLRFNETEAEALPVFEAERKGAKFVGVLSRQDALSAYCEVAEMA